MISHDAAQLAGVVYGFDPIGRAADGGSLVPDEVRDGGEEAVLFGKGERPIGPIEMPLVRTGMDNLPDKFTFRA